MARPPALPAAAVVDARPLAHLRIGRSRALVRLRLRAAPAGAATRGGARAVDRPLGRALWGRREDRRPMAAARRRRLLLHRRDGRRGADLPDGAAALPTGD